LIKFICGHADLELGKNIAAELGIPLGDVEISHFQDSEIRIKINEVTRSCDYFVLQSTCVSPGRSINDNIMELYLLVRTLKRNCARRVVAIIPYYGYGRQDRQDTLRVPISAADLALLYESAGTDQIISIDLHCGQIQGFFQKIPVENLPSTGVFVPYIASKMLHHPIVISPDAGGVSRANTFRENLLAEHHIETEMAVVIKQRASPGKISSMKLVGAVKDSDVIIVDDICDTGGTLIQAAKKLKESGAKRVFACVTHAIFSGRALEEIAGSSIDELVITDTIPLRGNLPANVRCLSIAPLISEAVLRLYHEKTPKTHLLQN